MSEPAKRWPLSTAFPISVEVAEQFWSLIEWLFSHAETWSLVPSFADFKALFLKGERQLFGVRNAGGHLGIAVTRLWTGARGAGCEATLIMPLDIDEAALASITQELEIFARTHSCAVLEILASPNLARRLPGKNTAAAYEIDLRQPARGH